MASKLLTKCENTCYDLTQIMGENWLQALIIIVYTIQYSLKFVCISMLDIEKK